MPGRRRTVVNYDEYIATARLAEDTRRRAARTLNEIPNWQVGNYQYDAQIPEGPALVGVGYAVYEAPARCHKEPQATTPKGEFEMDAD